MRFTVALMVVSLVTGMVCAAPPFSEQVQGLNAAPMQKSDTINLPIMTWGSEVPFLEANGGVTTDPGSFYGKNGMNIRIYKENDFSVQVRDYMAGKSPFLRGAAVSLGLASEIIGKDSRTKPVFLMLTGWSVGDHLVARDHIKTLNDLAPKNGKKRRIAVQDGGAHVGMLYDLLKTAAISKDDLEIIWVPEMAGEGSGADLFRKDSTIDACFTITPDMFGLVGDVDGVGTGAEGTVEGAHVVVSTMTMTHAIPDMLAVRSDFYEANREFVDKLVAGWFKHAEALVKLRNAMEESGNMSDEYRRILTSMQSVFGKDVIPSIELDGHGLLLDCVFEGITGNIAFFMQKGNMNGFEPFMGGMLDLAQSWGYAKGRYGFDPARFDYDKIASLAGLSYEQPKKAENRIRAEVINFESMDDMDDRTIVSFSINFDPNQNDFSSDRYGAEFERAVHAISRFGGAVVLIRGHSDPTQTLVDFLRSGISRGRIKQSGSAGNYRYYLDGDPLDPTQTDRIVQMIQDGQFDGGNPDPRLTLQAAVNLSASRAVAVREAIVDMANKRGYQIDASQIQPVGAGISEPLIAKPSNMNEARENMRVEFRVIRVPAEALEPADFDF